MPEDRDLLPTEPPLLEREPELAVLSSLVRMAVGGSGHLALIEGAAGIGKTRLLARTRAEGESRGALVLAARGSEIERDFPFGVVRQLFEGVVRQGERERWLLAGAASSARPIFESVEDSEDVSFSTLHGLYWLTVNLAARAPLLLAIDDLHWCDRASLRFVLYLLRRLDGLPVLVVASLRPAEPGADAAMLADLAADRATAVVRPRTLTAEASRSLIEQRLGRDAAPQFCDAVHRLSGGNPLLLEELLRGLEAERVPPEASSVADVLEQLGPRTAARSVLVRLARLSPDALAVARAVAVLGDDADPFRAAALAGIDAPAMGAATAELARSEILRPGHALGFVHPLVRAAVYEDASSSELPIVHARAAVLLRDAGAPEEQVAAHVLKAPRSGDPQVVATMVHAARMASARGAPESTVAYLRRALEEPASASDRPQLLFELGSAESFVDGTAAVATLRAAYESLEDPAGRGRAASVLGRLLLFLRPPGEATAIAREAQAGLPPELDDLRQGLEAFELLTRLFGASPHDFEARVARMRRGRSGDGAGARMSDAFAAWQWALAGGEAGPCVDLALEALEGGKLLRADPAFMPIAAIATLALADRREALDAWEALLAEAHEHGSVFAIAGYQLWRGWAVAQRGELVEAQNLLEQAWQSMVDLWRTDVGGSAPFAIGLFARVLVERGELAAAAAALARPGVAVEGSMGDQLLRGGQLELLLAEGRHAQALVAADQLAATLRETTNPAWSPWRSLKAQALDALGRREEAVALVESELAAAHRWGAPKGIGRALRVLGELERDRGRPRLEQAVAVLEPSTARLELARALVAQGRALRLARRPTEAREPLRRAYEIASVCGAAPVVELARAELAAAGSRPRVAALSGVGALTPSEQRVASLAAGGSSNREIAQTLYVTPKTVEVHLSATYRKLGIRSRRELERALVPAS